MIKVNSIQDILDIAEKHSIPLERMRFFIGVNCQEEKCFGIYYDNYTEKYIVYKNKNNGERVIRYQGVNEAEAAQIIMDKIVEETNIREKDKDWWEHQQNLATSSDYVKEYNKEIKNRNKQSIDFSTIMNGAATTSIILCIIAFVVLLLASLPRFTYQLYKDYQQSSPRTGYYLDDNNYYYFNKGVWYFWNDFEWKKYDGTIDYNNYNYNKNYSSNYQITDFKESDYYIEQNTNSNQTYQPSYDYDYDYDWSFDWDSSWDDNDFFDVDFGDWSSDYTDWGSDW